MLRVVFLTLVVGFGCGQEIGDECITGIDCSTEGTRVCDTSQREGYCTIQGCDSSTCPEEAACVRFFMGSFANRPCNPTTENSSTDQCSLDELCTLAGQCVPRSSEVRYCMKKCDTSGDCREGYECRDLELMKAHGGEPVLAPGLTTDESSPKFCAAAPPL